MPRPLLPLSLLLLVFTVAVSAAEEKDRLVRNTEPLAAEDQRKGFKLPEGFSIQLFADESLIGGKPINMAFDARGRLWVSSTQEYPYAVPKNRWSDPQGTRAKDSKDTIRILEDTDGDGRADKATVFADELNIPTGVLPYKKGCIAFSIPNLWYLEDTDGDGKCDKRRILFGPLGWEKDTHGMVSSLRLGLDGWVYATHGFSNTSHFEVRPENRKSEIRNPKSEMLDITSGSVFRFLPDGSRVEPWTTGQVNPFGLCWDSWGNLYSADCHSNPITQLIRGAHYPSFGKPHDGLGFAPNMCEHAHGSTGLCGVIYIDGDVWGPEWNDHMFVGNCVTSRVNHDHITLTGATPKANEAPDFLTCDDPWFRPVDLQLGPDSALYVADFYNCIIGHYEVPLDHPKRDRARGRIWRVVREGFTVKLIDGDLTRRTPEELIKAFDSGNLTQRLLAVSVFRKHLAGKSSKEAEPLIKLLRNGCVTSRQKAMGMWITGEDFSSERDDLTDAHRMLMWAETNGIADKWRLVGLLSSLSGEEEVPAPRIQAAACRATTQFGDDAETVAIVLAHVHARTPEADATLRHEALMALRQMAEAAEKFDLMAEWMSQPMADLKTPGAKEPALSQEDQALARKIKAVFATVLRSIPAEKSASWLLKEFANVTPTPELRSQTLTHIARHLPADRDGELVALVQKHFGDDLDTQLELFAAIREGRQAAKDAPSPPITTWSAELTNRLLHALQSEPVNTWQPVTPPTDTNPNPWRPASRKCADGKQRDFLDSHVAPGSEKHTGTLRSAPFALPKKLTFWLAGHNGFPTGKSHGMNFVRLVDAETGEELVRAYPPRHDAGHRVTWIFNRKEKRHEHIVLELVDRDNATAYAWLAAGGFQPAVVRIPGDLQKRDKRIRALAQLARSGVDSEPASSMLISMKDKGSFTPDTRVQLAMFLADRADAAFKPLAALVRDAELSPAVFAILQHPADASRHLASAFRTLPFRSQAKLGTSLASSVEGANRLLDLAPPAVLAEPLVSAKVKALKNASIDERVQKLTAALPPQNEALNKLMAQRLKSYDTAKPDPQRGEEVFNTACFICHRIGVRGNLVGPQLDGIGARGAERLLEDILDPNRAVDPAFRLHLVKRKDGSLYAGLMRREEGDAFVFADATAQETRIPKAEITSNEESPFSIMPPGLGEALNEQQLHDLLAYLLARK